MSRDCHGSSFIVDLSHLKFEIKSTSSNHSLYLNTPRHSAHATNTTHTPCTRHKHKHNTLPHIDTHFHTHTHTHIHTRTHEPTASNTHTKNLSIQTHRTYKHKNTQKQMKSTDTNNTDTDPHTTKTTLHPFTQKKVDKNKDTLANRLQNTRDTCVAVVWCVVCGVARWK